jgi:PKD repeat protein
VPGEPSTFSGASSEIDLWSAGDYTWTIAGATADTAATPTVSHTFTAPGVYPVQLTLTGTNGRTANITVNYAIVPPAGTSPAPPEFARFTNPKQALTGKAVTFNAAASGSSITNFSWDFDGSGSYADSSGTSPTIKHTFKTPGTYRIQLRATRAGGIVSTVTGSILVAPAPPRGHVGVRIAGGNFATDSTSVKLALVWPAYATQAVISNTGYGRSATTVKLARTEAWTLRSGGARVKRVYIRFTGPYIRARNVRDQIVVDRKPPTLTGAGLIGQVPGTNTYSVEIQAADPIAGICEAQSGSDTVSVANCQAKGITSLTQVVKFTASAPPQLVRVRNSAGVWSARTPVQQTAVGLPVPHRKIGS